MKKKLIGLLLSVTMTGMLCACGNTEPAAPAQDIQTETVSDEAGSNEQVQSTDEDAGETAETVSETDGQDSTEDEAKTPVEKNGEVYILVTSDVHCGVNQGFGYAGLVQVRESLEKQGYTTILVDDGDSIQGEAMGTLTQGEANVRLMNAVGYDVAIPGNHEFDYGADQFLKLVDEANYKYISCNFNREGELVLDPYTVIDTGDIKIGFVGVTTPESLTSSNPVHFQDENGKTIYGFCQTEDGSGVYEAVQNAVDAARADGADYVYIMGHMGLEETAKPYTYADVISHTNGIDAFLDGHSHDTEQIVMKNKDGEDVYRCAVGTKMQCIGYSHITSEGILETNIWSWPNETDAPTLLGIDNPVNDAVQTELAALDEILNQEVCEISFDLMDKDPEVRDSSGNLIRVVRMAETNLGDLCADAFRDATGADIGFINGGGIRAGIGKGKVTYGDIIAVFPFGNNVCVIEATGQQILDALEWGSRGVPEENGGFLQVSGLTYEIDASVDNPCTADPEGNMTGISGKRRVSNVLVNGEPIDPKATYTVGSQSFTLLDNGDGFTCFDGCNVLYPEVCMDNEALINYMTKTLTNGGGSEYADPYGQDRIIIKE
ncbi:MAG: bifunctional metallophosphatase/5'-nucleotidase [Lachnospiraceae bacterium]|nr:bifunctional metallophosphatase/5'-nucleotidase [Lachnospiraceae bacterium]